MWPNLFELWCLNRANSGYPEFCPAAANPSFIVLANSKFDLKAEKPLLPSKNKEKRHNYLWISVCVSLMIHIGVIDFFVRSGHVHLQQRDLEPIPVELIRAASLTGIDPRQPPVQTSGSKSGNPAEKSKNNSAGNDQPLESAEPKAAQPRKSDDSPELKRKSPNIKQTQDVSRSKPNPQSNLDQQQHREKEAARNVMPGQKGSKTTLKTAVLESRASSQISGQSKSLANPQGKMIPQADFGSGTHRLETKDKTIASVSLPNIPFDPEVFRAVAVPLPGTGGGEPASYKEIVFGLLERAKHYPETALARGARGTAVVAFSLDSTGSVIERLLLHSSGDPDLDAESLELVNRASPFPPPPAGAQHIFSAEIGFGVAAEEQ